MWQGGRGQSCLNRWRDPVCLGTQRRLTEETMRINRCFPDEQRGRSPSAREEQGTVQRAEEAGRARGAVWRPYSGYRGESRRAQARNHQLRGASRPALCSVRSCWHSLRERLKAREVSSPEKCWVWTKGTTGQGEEGADARGFGGRSNGTWWQAGRGTSVREQGLGSFLGLWL